MLIVERWILARLRNRTFFSLAGLNSAIAELREELNNRPMRHVGKSRRELFEEIERSALRPLPATPFEYAEWRSAKVHPDYHVEVNKTFYSVPHRLIGRTVQVRLTHRVVEIFHDHQRVASHVHRSQRSGHVTVNAHMPTAHQRYANTTPTSLIARAAKIGPNAAILVERNPVPFSNGKARWSTSSPSSSSISRAIFPGLLIVTKRSSSRPVAATSAPMARRAVRIQVSAPP